MNANTDRLLAPACNGRSAWTRTESASQPAFGAWWRWLWLVVCLMCMTCQPTTAVGQMPDQTKVEEPSQPVRRRPAFFRLPVEARTKLIVGLGLVVLLGVVAVVSIHAIGRMFRLYAHGSRYEPARGAIQSDDWASKPLVEGHHETDGGRRSRDEEAT